MDPPPQNMIHTVTQEPIYILVRSSGARRRTHQTARCPFLGVRHVCPDLTATAELPPPTHQGHIPTVHNDGERVKNNPLTDLSLQPLLPLLTSHSITWPLRSPGSGGKGAGRASGQTHW